MSQEVLTFGSRKITLIGTAHISHESINEVTETIRTLSPDCVAIELDEKRCEAVKNPDSWRELDIVKVLRKGQGFLLLANLILASLQKRMGQNVGVKPGDEMLAAMKVAEELNIPAEMVDRPIQTTLRRAWGKNSFSGKMKLLGVLLGSAFSREEVSEEQIEDLKNRSEMDSMMGELSDYMPKIKEVLIDERDKYLASHIWECKGNDIVAVLGAGHLPGVIEHLKKISKNEETTDTTEISSVPKKSAAGKILAWTIPVVIVAALAAAFYFKGPAGGWVAVLSWIIWNGALAAIGTLLAGGHPLSILGAFVTAPFTSLCPLVGVGMVTGIIQGSVCKPKVKDMETLSDDSTGVKGFYKNRILRVLLVFILSSIGSSIGTFAGGASIVENFLKKDPEPVENKVKETEVIQGLEEITESVQAIENKLEEIK